LPRRAFGGEDKGLFLRKDAKTFFSRAYVAGLEQQPIRLLRLVG